MEIQNLSSSFGKYFTSEHSEQVKYFQHEKIDFVSPSGHVLFYYLFYYINTNEIPNHFTETVLSCERRDLLCSHSNSDIFTCRNNMIFWYFIGVYIIIVCILSTSVTNNNLLSSQNEMPMLNFFPMIFDLFHL